MKQRAEVPSLTFQEVKTLCGDFIECRWGPYVLGSGRTEYEAARAAQDNIVDMAIKLKDAGYKFITN
jgi:hypothetical protein